MTASTAKPVSRLSFLVQPLVRLLGGGADRLFLQLAVRDRRSGRRATRTTIGPRIEEASRLYPQAEAEGRLFSRPMAAELTETVQHQDGGGTIVDLTWPSRYEPIHPAYGAVLERCPENRVCHARWFRHRQPRPALICLHGWGGGYYWLEGRAFRAPWLYRQGLDVILATLPFHARRAPSGRFTPMFPSTDPVRSNEGFAQAVSDLRALIFALRSHGTPAVGVAGMSLGGFTSVLMGTVEPGLDAVVGILPFSSLPEFFWNQGKGTPARARAEAAGLTLARYSAAFLTIEPLKRVPLIVGEKVLLVAGQFDRVCPVAHAQLLMDHFVGSRLLTFPGSHLVHVGRHAMFDGLVRFLEGLGMVGTV